MAGFLHEGGRQKSVAGELKEHAYEGMLSTSYSTGHLFSKTNTAAETTAICSSLAHQIQWYFIKILGGACMFSVVVGSPSHSTPPRSSSSSPPLPLEHTAEENIRFQALQTSSLNQHPVKLWVKGRNTSLPNHKGCNECGLIGWYKSCAARISSWQWNQPFCTADC